MPYDATGFEIETQTVTEPWRKVLLDAADMLDREGWGQGFGEQKRCGKKCAALAIYHDSGSAGLDALDRFVEYIGVEDCFAVFLWNDAPGRTASEVTAALRACARQP